MLDGLSVDGLKEAEVEHLEWRKGNQPGSGSQLERRFVGSWGLFTYASLLDQKGLPRRIVVRECYLTYTANDYRPGLVRLKNLRALS
ncbi:hypothetical protein B0A49_12919 [Cryomyces minteri]|uniref:Uncharacterized protein n=1 Tax=Cryomyces minteri TaxID=331657 RepID=A0A4U0W8T1_9PEZI|nr:hypothetical protein B0A49_12919 [Cryomyces minteri]